MKKVVLAVFFILIGASMADAKPTAPQLFFSYSHLYDSVCANTPERKIDPLWVEEAIEKVPH